MLQRAGLVLAVVLGSLGVAIVLAVLAMDRARVSREKCERKPLGPVITNDRIANVVSLMTAQDTITWTVAGISFATQGALAGFFVQSGLSSAGRILLPLGGIYAALAFLLVVMRSNWYMSRYMNMLRETGRHEYAITGAPDYSPSATTVVHAAHGAIAVLWLVSLIWALASPI